MICIIHDTYSQFHFQSPSLLAFPTVDLLWIYCNYWYNFMFSMDFGDLMGFERFYIFELLLSNGTSTVIIVQYMLVFMYDCSTDNNFFVAKNVSSADSAPDELVLVEPVPSQKILPMDSWCRSRLSMFSGSKI